MKQKSIIITHSKLNKAKMKQIKTLLRQNKTLKYIAEKFGINDMQVYRIKTGENWKHVTAWKRQF